MALLTIAEPGQSAAPHQRKLAVGIDLGTTNSLVSTIRNGSLEILKDEQGRELCPSVVQYNADQAPLVGYEALEAASNDPQNTIVSVKRFIGKKLAEIQDLYPNLPYSLTESANGLPVFETKAGNKNAIEVSAEILSKLKKLAQDSLGGDLHGAVITVPAYFDDTQRQATKDAAKLAGINVLRILNEPTAAAVAYGVNAEQEGIIAVYDLGGGTFDVSILAMEKGVFRVLATGGNTQLGGDDFDHQLVAWLGTKLSLNAPELSKVQQRQVVELAIAIKKALTEQEELQVASLAQYQVLVESLNLEANSALSITRAEFNQLINKLVQSTLMVCNRVLKDAKVTKDQLSEVILVGGSTRVPYVQESVAKFFAKQPLCSINPDLVVAMGAAMQADLLAGNSEQNYLLLDVLPLSLGVEMYGGLVEKIIPRNTTIPVARAQEFTTAQDGQTGLKLHVVQGERDMATDCRSLASFSLKGLPPRAAGALKIRVTYQVDADGILSVNANELTTGVSTDVQVKLSYGLTEDEVIKMIMESAEYAELDVAMRKLQETIGETSLLCDSVRIQLNRYGELLKAEEYSQIERNLNYVLKLIKQYDLTNIDRSTLTAADAQRIKERANEITFWSNQLEVSTREFAAEIMTQNIKEVLTGKDINQM